MNKYYAGIGSRTAPDDTLEFMTKMARILDCKGYILRSGGAKGADTAFANGASKKEIFRSKDATPEAIKLAMEVHPAPHNCNDYVKKLHGRNAQIVLGKDLIAPVEFVMLWTPGGKTIGGSGLAIRLAERENIMVYNLFNKDDLILIHEKFLY